MTAADRSTGHGQDAGRGATYGALAYAIWGAFPLYFHLLAPAGAWEILGHRILWTLLFCGSVLAVRRDLAWGRSLLDNPRLLGAVTLAGLLIAINWVIYVSAVVAHHVTEASLGYFLNPIVTVAIGVVVLREKLRSLQWLAVAIGFTAGVYLSVDFGRPPWIALSLAFLFAAAARRVPLVTIGLLQFITPVLQLICGVVLLGETMSPSRWIGFGIVWVALLVLTFDSIRSVRTRRRLADAADCAAV